MVNQAKEVCLSSRQVCRRARSVAFALHAGALSASGLVKSTQSMTLPIQHTRFGSPRGACDHGIQLTSHREQVIRQPPAYAPGSLQFQHRPRSPFCWLPLISFRHPPQLSRRPRYCAYLTEDRPPPLIHSRRPIGPRAHLGPDGSLGSQCRRRLRLRPVGRPGARVAGWRVSTRLTGEGRRSDGG